MPMEENGADKLLLVTKQGTESQLGGGMIMMLQGNGIGERSFTVV